MGANSSNLHNDDLSQTTLKTNATKESVQTIVGHLSTQFRYILAIDVGTMYSGYAYARKDDLNLDTGKINDIWCRQVWNSERANLMSNKTSTCILLNSDKELDSFGFEAEDKFLQIVEEKRQNEYYFFRCFKMVLYDKKITSELFLTDEAGKTLPAKLVFGKSIFALKQDFFKNMNQRAGKPVEPHAVRYVLTVPAIWGDAAKQFMREAAIEAGIKTAELLLVLEPEAASIYNQFLRVEGLNNLKLTISQPGTRYVVVDLGAGTVDIVVHKILSTGFVKETHRCRGNDCGGYSINNAFLQFCTEIIDESVFREMQNKDPSTLVELHREIEKAKKTVDGKQNTDFRIRLPHHFVDGFIKEQTGCTIESIIKRSHYDDKIAINRGYLCVNQSLVIEKCFKSTKDKIIQLINQAVVEVEEDSSEPNSKINKILLVGGFSDSYYIQNAVRENFPHKQVIIPEAAELCVLKGGVLFGHSPHLISHRVVRFTYGISTSEQFNSTKHEEKRKFIYQGKEYCNDMFCSYICIGSVVEIGKTITKKLQSAPYQKTVSFIVVTSLSSNPKYTDEEDCAEVGKLTVDIVNPTKDNREFEVGLIFGNTEIQVFAKDVVTGKEEKAMINFILY